MKLSVLYERDSRTYTFDYEKFKVDPRPQALYFGSWRHPTTGNRLMCGLNLNYLNTEQQQRLQTILPQIFRAGEDLESGTRGRVRRFKSLAQDIFDIGYRTYDRKYVASVSVVKGTIPHLVLSPAGVEFEKEQAAKKGLEAPETGVPSTVAPAPAPAPEAPPAPEEKPEMPERPGLGGPEEKPTPKGLPEPEEEPEEAPVKKKTTVDEPKAPPALGFKAEPAQKRVKDDHKAEPKTAGTPIQPKSKPTSLQQWKLGLGKSFDWLRSGAKKIGSAVRGLFKPRPK